MDSNPIFRSSSNFSSAGIRANLIRTFSAIPAARMMRPPNERARLYFVLAWFHAVVQVSRFDYILARCDQV